MPRSARKRSETGYYHLIVRGNARQIIFEEQADYIRFLHLLKRFGLETQISICAFCLMENHVHILIYDQTTDRSRDNDPRSPASGEPENNHVSLFMQKLGVSYSYYFNQKYHRTGHLFEDRFTGIPIESEDHLLTTFRYILNNPRKAGICEASEYQWSSYNRYGNPHSFVDTTVLQELLGSFDEYAAYIAAKYEEEEPPKEQTSVHDDEWAKEEIHNLLNVQSCTDLQAWDWNRRTEALRLLKEHGLSVRQIARLTGISKSAVQRA